MEALFAVMPRGVEHAAFRQSVSTRFGLPALFAVMPRGVEHCGARSVPSFATRYALFAVMPRGVEHPRAAPAVQLWRESRRCSP